MPDPELLKPSVDPNVKKIGIRKVTARNEASVMNLLRSANVEVITDWTMVPE